MSLITLGVADLERSVAFYGELGWVPGNDWREQDVAFFQCGGMVLALWDRDEVGDGQRHDRESARLCGDPRLERPLAGGRRCRPSPRPAPRAPRSCATAPRPFGAATPAAFLDPDGHPWEVAHNPHWTVAPDGSIGLGS